MPIQNFKLKFGLIFLLIPVLFLVNLVFAREINITRTDVSPTPEIVVAEKIQQGIKLLKSSPPLLYETTRKNLKGDLVRKQIALAILDLNTGNVFQKRIWVKEKEIKNARKTGIINVEPAIPNEPLDIEIQWWNSFNSLFSVANQPELVVVADKYLLQSSDLYTLPERAKTKYTDIIYTPYSRALHQPEFIEAGKQYLEENIDQAYAELESDKVFSHSVPGTIITSGMSKDFIRNIILVEHVDPDNFSVAADGGRDLTERVLALIGANQNSAYRYTGSPAGASGMAQFIKSTYKSIVNSYPEAHLIKDYTLGMADHKNAIKAMVLFFDNRKQELNNKVTRLDILQSLGITEEMLAAAYNGGGTRVAKSVNKFGLAWISGQLNLPRSKRIFKQETLDYIKKFQSVKNLNLFANISGS